MDIQAIVNNNLDNAYENGYFAVIKGKILWDEFANGELKKPNSQLIAYELWDYSSDFKKLEDFEEYGPQLVSAIEAWIKIKES